MNIFGTATICIMVAFLCVFWEWGVKIFVKIVAMITGSVLVGTAINGFLVPHHLLDGGIVGIALILHYYFEFRTGLWTAILSVPLSIYAWFNDRRQFYGSFQGMIVTAFFIDVLAPLEYQFALPIWLSSVLGGAISGVGVGLMLRYKTSTGGTDLLAYFISKATPLNIGLLIFLIDGVIVLMGFPTLGLESLLFSTLTIFIAGAVASVCYERI
jgi:uncharacterized membrane-anchored protein YitT (DUF2179 family)